MGKKKKKNRLYGFDYHHVIPRARGGGGNNNLCRTEKEAHAFFHKYTDFHRGGLTTPRTPVEVIEWIVNTFWNGDWKHVEVALKKNKEES